MKKLKLKLQRNYKSSTSGKTVFVYVVSGPQSSLESYKDFQGEMLRYEDNDDSKNPLYFTTNYAGREALLEESTSENGGWYVDRSADVEMNSLLEQAGDSPLGRALAAQIAAEKLAAIRSTMKSSTAPAKKEEPTDDLGGL